MSDHPLAVICIVWKYLQKAEFIKLLVAVYGMENLALSYWSTGGGYTFYSLNHFYNSVATQEPIQYSLFGSGKCEMLKAIQKDNTYHKNVPSIQSWCSYSTLSSAYTYTYISRIRKFVTMTVGCEISHKHTKYAKHYQHFIYSIKDHLYT
jgi:hypothetical protein